MTKALPRFFFREEEAGRYHVDIKTSYPNNLTVRTTIGLVYKGPGGWRGKFWRDGAFATYLAYIPYVYRTRKQAAEAIYFWHEREEAK
jgi:hypothetical protein